MVNKKILYLCDLNLANGGAQRVTIETLPGLSKVFDIFLYMPHNPSSESLKIINNLAIQNIIDLNLKRENIEELVLKERIELILIQWENPKWIILCHEIWKETEVNYAILMYELPFINTPTTKILVNWKVQANIKMFSDLFKNFINRSKPQTIINKEVHLVNPQPLNEYRKVNPFSLKRIRNFAKNFYKVKKTREGLVYAKKIIAMGGASKFYIDKYFGFKNIIEVKHCASSDIQSVEGMISLELKYDICFMAARLESGKGIFDLLDVVYDIKKLLQREINVAIMGRFIDTVTKEKFNKKLKKLKLQSNVILLGFVSESQKVSTLCSSKIFLYPSKKDSFSISLANALFCGLPSVTYDLPFIQQFNEISIYKTKYKDIEGMSKKIVSLLKMSELEPLKFQKLRDTIRHSFNANFNWSKSCEEQIGAIKIVLEEIT